MVRIFRDLRHPRWRIPSRRCLAAIGIMVLLSGCESEYFNAETVETDPTKGDTPMQGSILGGGGANFLFGPGGPSKIQPGGGISVGVNAYLWRATLDTVSIWPVASADPFGGVIITDWHSPEGVLQERCKMNVFILVRSLRADGVRVSLFRQVRDRGGTWRDAGVPVQTATRIEDAILTRARQLRSEFLRR